MNVVEAAGGLEVKVHSDVLARSVRLSYPDDATVFEDNYFDLLPGETRSVAINTTVPANVLKRALEVRSLADAF